MNPGCSLLLGDRMTRNNVYSVSLVNDDKPLIWASVMGLYETQVFLYALDNCLGHEVPEESQAMFVKELYMMELL